MLVPIERSPVMRMPLLRSKVIALLAFSAIGLRVEAADPAKSWNGPVAVLGKLFTSSSKQFDAPIHTSNRREIAELIFEACSEYAARIPVLSPREEDWLSTELGASDRFVLTIKSQEYAKQQAGALSRNCAMRADTLRKFSDDKKAVRSEMLNWALLVSITKDPDFDLHIDNLSRANSGMFGTRMMEEADTLESVSRYIYDLIVLPYLIQELQI